MSYDDILGPRPDPRYLRALARQREERRTPLPPVACTPADLEETGDGWPGLLVVLAASGWRLRETRGADGRVVLWADGDGYSHGTSGASAPERALAAFKSLYSDEPDAIAAAAAFWQPPEPVSYLPTDPKERA